MKRVWMLLKGVGVGHPKMSIQTHVKRRLVIVEKYHSLIVLNCDLKRSKKEKITHTPTSQNFTILNHMKRISRRGVGD